MADRRLITPPPPHLLKKFSAQAQDEAKKRNGAGYLKTFATLCIEWAMNSKTTPNDRQIRSSEIEPSPELVQQWLGEFFGCVVSGELPDSEKFLATQAANWGADQELDACCEWFVRDWTDIETADKLRAARRPKLKRLGEIALVSLETIEEDLMVGDEAHPNDLVAIRRALEKLQELEGQQ